MMMTTAEIVRCEPSTRCKRSSQQSKGVGEAWEVPLDIVDRGNIDVWLVREARQEEMDFIRRQGIGDYATSDACIRHTGKTPTKVRW